MGDAVVAEAVRKYEIEDSDVACHDEWARVLGRFKEEVGEAAYRSWLLPVSLQRVGDGEAVIAAPTRFLRDWVAAHYADRLLALWRTENQRIRRVLVVVSVAAPPMPAAYPSVASTKTLRQAAPSVSEPAAALDAGEDKMPASGLDGRFTFENFVVGKPNEFAHAAARHVAEACVSPVHTVPFNPLFLYGGVGLGKTHLMHAVAWHVRRHACQRKVIYLSAEKFMYQFVRALRFKSTMDFKEEFRSVDMLMIDDLQFISGKDFDPGGVLPHLQRAGGPEPADRDLGRQITERS